MNGQVRSSAGLVWRHQRLVWWIFAVNLLIAWLSSLSTRATLSTVLDHSLESAKLVTGFDLGTLALLLERPDVSVRALAPGAVGAALIFVVYLLFIDGGVFRVFLEDREVSHAEFFENAGLFFWRMLRLALYSALPFGLLAAAAGGISGYAGKLASNAPQERLGFFVNVAGNLVMVVAALWVRMWFDLTQARVVRDHDRRLLRMLARSLNVASRSGKLFVKYIGIGLFAAAMLGAGIGAWVFLPHAATAASFLLLELVTITQIGSRLWMKAASASSIARLPVEAVLPPPPVDEAPAPVVEGTDVQSPLPE
jgi:uncharacterized MnhB-related membrane protein